MASIDECEQAFHALADRLADSDSARSKAAFDRTLSCTLRDLSVTFTGRLRDGHLTNIRRVDASSPNGVPAQVRMTMLSDDLLGLVAGEVKMSSAWATGRIKIDASILDLLRLRTVF